MFVHRAFNLFIAALLVGFILPAFAGSLKSIPRDGVVVSEKYLLLEGDVVKIDRPRRIVVLKNDQGETPFVVSKKIKNFAEIKVGDHLNVSFEIGVLIELVSAKSNIRSEVQTTIVTTANQGEKPNGSVMNKTVVISDVVEIDREKRTISIKGIDGHISSIHVKNKKLLSKIALNDQIKVVYFDEMKGIVSVPQK